MSEITKLRTIQQIHATIKELDPDSAISKNFIRDLVIGGYIPFVEVGAKRLINLDDVLNYLHDNSKTMKERQQEAH